MLTVEYNDHGTVKRLTELGSQARNPRQMMLSVGRELGNQLKGHFQIRDRNQANKLSSRREHFWLKVGQSVQAPVVDANGQAVHVTINDPRFAQKVFGGRIVAKNAGALTIPQTEEAYGRTAHQFEQETGLTLFLVKKDGNAFLAATVDGQMKVEYILTPSVEQAADPDALPREELLNEAITKRAEVVVGEQLREGGMT